MQISGHVENGVVVLDGGVSLPEGTRVVVLEVTQVQPSPETSAKRVELPLVKTGVPGGMRITNERIHEMLESEDIEAVKQSWNAPS